MSILIVTYDLRSPKDYHDFYEVVKQQGKWWHYMASTWLLSTHKTPQEVADAIFPYMDSQDLLFVGDLGTRYQGRLPKPAWDWIQAETSDHTSAILSLLGVNPLTGVGDSPLSGLTPPPKFSQLGIPGIGIGDAAEKKDDPGNLSPWIVKPPPKK